MIIPLTIGFPYPSDRFGGSTASSLVLAKALQRLGYRVHILIHGDGGHAATEAAQLGLPLHHLPALSDIPGYARPDRFRLEHMRSFRSNCAAIRELELDIVHVNDVTMLRSWTMPTFWTSTRFVAHWRSNYKSSWSVRAGLRLADVVIAVSGYSLEKLPAWVQRKGIVEYNSFDLHIEPERKEAARRDVRHALGLPENAVLVAMFGNHLKRKRTHVLADVIAAIPQTNDGRPVFGIACGSPAEPYDSLLDVKITEFALQKRLIKTGFVRPVEKWMAACDVLLAPAIDEPLARNVLEAQGLGVPVIVSTDGGLKELIRNGENGLLCDPYDIGSWIDETRHLLSNHSFVEKLVDGGQALVAGLKPELHASRISDIYQKLNDSGRRHGKEKCPPKVETRALS